MLLDEGLLRTHKGHRHGEKEGKVWFPRSLLSSLVDHLCAAGWGRHRQAPVCRADARVIKKGEEVNAARAGFVR